MHFDFDKPIERRNTDSVKWSLFDKDVLPLWVADMDFESPPAVMDALKERIDHGIFGYGITSEGLKDQVLLRLERYHHMHVEPASLVFTPGIVTAFNIFLRAFGSADNGVIVQPPVYPPILSAPVIAGLRRLDNTLLYGVDGRYTIDFDLLETQAREASLLLLCNPHNPSGRVFTHDELEKMGEIVLKNDLLICSDEIHCDLVYKGYEHLSIASLSQELSDRCVTLIAPSKTFNIAGLECSIAIIPNEELRKRYTKATDGLFHGVNILGSVAAEAAYRGGGEWLNQLLVYLKSNRDYVIDRFRSDIPEIRCYPAEGTYLAWLDCRGLSLKPSPRDFFHMFARVALNDGEDFGIGGQGFARLNFGCPRATLTEAMDRLIRAIRNRA